jgi:hypothetical protein
MLDLKRQIYIILLICFSLNSSTALSDDRAEHQDLKRFLDCQIKGNDDCKLKKPIHKAREQGKALKQKKISKENKRTKSQKFIFGTYKNRSNKSKGSPR